MKTGKKKILELTGLSNEVFELFRFELNMFFVRLNSTLNPFKRNKINQYSKQSNIRLNIGAGPFGEEGWINIDMFRMKNISFTYDCRKKIPLRNNSVEVIRCEHVLEHMDKQYEAIIFLKECFRVLKTGGIIRVVVSDIEKFIKAYYEKNWKSVGIDYELKGHWQEADVLTHIFRQGGEHKFGYDFSALSYLLSECGFVEIYKTSYGQSLSTALTSDQANHQFHSLYIEAIK